MLHFEKHAKHPENAPKVRKKMLHKTLFIVHLITSYWPDWLTAKQKFSEKEQPLQTLPGIMCKKSVIFPKNTKFETPL